MKTVYYDIFPFLNGQMFIVADEKGLIYSSLSDNAELDFREAFGNEFNLFQHGPRMTEYRTQLEDYSVGKIKKFDFNVNFLDGTPLQQKVWKKLMRIPYGKTMTVKQLTSTMKMKSSRTINSAILKNPIEVVIADHRIIANNGLLGDYRDGLDAKIRLLELEGVSPIPLIEKPKKTTKKKAVKTSAPKVDDILTSDVDSLPADNKKDQVATQEKTSKKSTKSPDKNKPKE